MIRKAILSIMGLAAAATFPAIYFGATDFWKKASGKGTAAAGPAATAPAAPGTPAAPATSTPLQPPALALEGTAVRDLTEVLRFDVTPQWIMGRWPRVSTGLAQLQLQGYRVPLVTGTAENDLAGALTYYFNPQMQVQRITFHGTTGDASKLVNVVAARFQLTRRLTNDPGLIVYEAVNSSGKPASALRLRSAPIIKASEPYKRFEVELVLERPEA